jgi:hypothetical protein
VSLVATLACHSAEALPEARQLMERYFAARASGDDATLLSLHHPVFHAEQPPERWLQTLSEMDARLGPLVGHHLERRKLVAGVKRAGVGSYVLLTYAVRYARAETRESFVLFKPGKGGEVRIVDHQLEATRFIDAEPSAPQDGAP